MVLGMLVIVTSLATILGVPGIAEITILGYLLGAPLWALWLGVTLLREAPVALLQPAT